MDNMQSLVNAAKHLYETCQLEEALAEYRKVLVGCDFACLPDDLLVEIGELASTLGDKDTAIAVFTKSISQNPALNPFKYFSLAQCYTGTSALALYQAGIQHYTEDLNRPQLSKAYSAMAELYMTDLCDEPDAEGLCENSIQKAIEIDGNSIDAWHTLANLRLIRQRIAEAQVALNRVKLILENCEGEQMPGCELIGEIVRGLCEVGDYEGLIVVSEIGLNMDNTQNDVMYMQAFGLMKLGKTEECLEVVRVLKGRELAQEILEATREIEESLLSN